MNQLRKMEWLWVFAAGAAFGAGKLNRTEFLPHLPLAEAPESVRVLLHALGQGDSEAILRVFYGLGVEIKAAPDLFPRLLLTLQQANQTAVAKQKALEALFKLEHGALPSEAMAPVKEAIEAIQK